MVRKRQNRIHFYLNDKELEHFDKLVKDSGYGRGPYIRMLINKVIPPPLITNELDQVLRQLRKIGTNMNQIAYVANATKCIKHEEYRKNHDELQETIFEIYIHINMPSKLEGDYGNDKDMGSQ